MFNLYSHGVIMHQCVLSVPRLVEIKMANSFSEIVNKIKLLIENIKQQSNVGEHLDANQLVQAYGQLFELLLADSASEENLFKYLKESPSVELSSLYLQLLTETEQLIMALPKHFAYKAVLQDRLSDNIDVKAMAAFNETHSHTPSQAVEKLIATLQPMNINNVVEVRTWGTDKELGTGVATMIDNAQFGNDVGHVALVMKLESNSTNLELVKKYCLDSKGQITIPFELKRINGKAYFEIYWSYWPKQLRTMEHDYRHERAGLEFHDIKALDREVPRELSERYILHKFRRNKEIPLARAAERVASHGLQSPRRAKYLKLKSAIINHEEQKHTLEFLLSNYMAEGKTFHLSSADETSYKSIPPSSNFLTILSRFKEDFGQAPVVAKVLKNKLLKAEDFDALMDEIRTLIAVKSKTIAQLSADYKEALLAANILLDAETALTDRYTNQQQGLASVFSVDELLEKVQNSYHGGRAALLEQVQNELMQVEQSITLSQRLKAQRVAELEKALQLKEASIINAAQDVNEKLSQNDNLQSLLTVVEQCIKLEDEINDLRLRLKGLPKELKASSPLNESIQQKSLELRNLVQIKGLRQVKQKSSSIFYIRAAHSKTWTIDGQKSIEAYQLQNQQQQHQLKITALSLQQELARARLAHQESIKRIELEAAKQDAILVAKKNKGHQRLLESQVMSLTDHRDVVAKGIRQGLPYQSISLADFNIENMLKLANSKLKEEQGFDLYKKNCSTTCMALLNAGAPASDQARLFHEYQPPKHHYFIDQYQLQVRSNFKSIEMAKGVVYLSLSGAKLKYALLGADGKSKNGVLDIEVNEQQAVNLEVFAREHKAQIYHEIECNGHIKKSYSLVAKESNEPFEMQIGKIYISMQDNAFSYSMLDHQGRSVYYCPLAIDDSSIKDSAALIAKYQEEIIAQIESNGHKKKLAYDDSIILNNPQSVYGAARVCQMLQSGEPRAVEQAARLAQLAENDKAYNRVMNEALSAPDEEKKLLLRSVLKTVWGLITKLGSSIFSLIRDYFFAEQDPSFVIADSLLSKMNEAIKQQIENGDYLYVESQLPEAAVCEMLLKMRSSKLAIPFFKNESLSAIRQYVLSLEEKDSLTNEQQQFLAKYKLVMKVRDDRMATVEDAIAMGLKPSLCLSQQPNPLEGAFYQLSIAQLEQYELELYQRAYYQQRARSWLPSIIFDWLHSTSYQLSQQQPTEETYQQLQAHIEENPRSLSATIWQEIISTDSIVVDSRAHPSHSLASAAIQLGALKADQTAEQAESIVLAEKEQQTSDKRSGPMVVQPLSSEATDLTADAQPSLAF